MENATCPKWKTKKNVKKRRDKETHRVGQSKKSVFVKASPAEGRRLHTNTAFARLSGFNRPSCGASVERREFRCLGFRCLGVCTLYPKDTASCVSARTVHECTVAFGSGWEGGTCWEVQRVLPARPALQKGGRLFFCFGGEVWGAHLLSGAEARSSSPCVEEKEQDTARPEPEGTSARTQKVVQKIENATVPIHGRAECHVISVSLDPNCEVWAEQAPLLNEGCAR